MVGGWDTFLYQGGVQFFKKKYIDQDWRYSSSVEHLLACTRLGFTSQSLPLASKGRVLPAFDRIEWWVLVAEAGNGKFGFNGPRVPGVGAKAVGDGVVKVLWKYECI